jgi:hypothetical protein
MGGEDGKVVEWQISGKRVKQKVFYIQRQWRAVSEVDNILSPILK